MTKFCVICGNGSAPFEVASKIKDLHSCVKCVLIDGVFDDSRLLDFDNEVINIAKIGKFFDYLKCNVIDSVVMIGGLKMPKLSELKPDFRGSILLSKILMLKNKGDDSILQLIESEIKKEGFNIISANEFLSDGKNILISKELSSQAIEDIKLGVDYLNSNSDFDIGQGVVISGKRIVGIEACEGTDKLIARCGEYFNERLVQNKMILVKKIKKNQSKTVDMPTIGLATVKNAYSNNFSGVAIDFRNTILLDKEEIDNFIKKNNFFIYDIAKLSNF